VPEDACGACGACWVRVGEDANEHDVGGVMMWWLSEKWLI